LDCKDCEQVYIGQTKRHLKTRVREHRNNIKNASGNNSVITNHRLSTNHESNGIMLVFYIKKDTGKKRDSRDVLHQKIQEE